MKTAEETCLSKKNKNIEVLNLTYGLGEDESIHRRKTINFKQIRNKVSKILLVKKIFLKNQLNQKKYDFQKSNTSEFF